MIAISSRELAARGGFEARYTDGLDETGWIRRLYDSARAKNLTAGVEMPPFEVFWVRGYFELPRPQRAFVHPPLRTPHARRPSRLRQPCREVGLDHEHCGSLSVQAETLHVVDRPDRELVHQLERHRRQPGPGDARDRPAGRLERGEERNER